MKLWLDTETFSATPIKHGTYKYVADCELMVATWAVDDGPVEVWDRTANPATPAALELALMEADEVSAHNAMFDRNVIAKHLPHCAPPLEKWRCTMVQALCHSLPGGLDKLCDILRIAQDQAKIKAGKELVNLFCKPRPKTSKVPRATRETHPAEWQRFLEYAGADILAMRAVQKALPNWNYKGEELALWHLDQRINDCGFAVDFELAHCAIGVTDREQERLGDEVWHATGGAVDAATQRDALLEHLLAEYGVSLPDLQGSTVERRLNDPQLPEGLKELLRLRLQASTSSTSKYKALVRGTTGGRLRGTLQFCGAGRTGRWAGRTFQPQNLPRPSRGFDGAEQERAVAAIKSGAAPLIYDNLMETTSNCIRGCIVAPEGRKLVVADLANIEGRVLAWLAGEQWKLRAFQAYDEGTGPDLYNLAYAKAFGIRPEDVDKFMRQIGKVMELMLGYQGGVGAFITGAATYKIDLDDMAKKAWPAIPGDVVYEAEKFYEWSLTEKRPTYGLYQRTFVVCDSLKRLWRRAHPRVEALWNDLQDTVIAAVNSPGLTLTCGLLKVRRDGEWLRIGLPSGRVLCYPQPKAGPGFSYMGMNQYTRQWQRLRSYGGKLVENVDQAISRDVLVHGMRNADSHGYDVVLTVHDELITEAPDQAEANADELGRCMTDAPAWAEGLPLAAAGFEAFRYRKD